MSDESAEVFTGQGVTRKRSTRGWGLASFEAIRRRLARVASDMDQGNIPLDLARALVYALNTTAQVLKMEKDVDHEERLCKLEELDNRTELNTGGKG